MEDVLQRFADAVNRREWAALSSLFKPSVQYNGSQIPVERLVEEQRQEIASMPDFTLRVDNLVHPRPSSSETQQLAARLLITATVERPYRNVPPSAAPICFARHMMWLFDEAGSIAEMDVITDVDEMREQKPFIRPILPSPRPSPQSGAGAQQDLVRFYHDYIAAINAQTLEADLAKFCQPQVSWCERRLGLDEYRGLMEDSFAAISGLAFRVRRLVVDAEMQQIAARIEFSGTPVRTYAGVGPSGGQVHFAEHVFYWLEQGKIARVATVIDWETYRKQMGH